MPLCLALRSFIEPADCSSLACVLESGTPRIFANERGESLLLGSLLSLDVDKYIVEMINCFYDKLIRIRHAYLSNVLPTNTKWSYCRTRSHWSRAVGVSSVPILLVDSIVE